jgi:hypothetical protein
LRPRLIVRNAANAAVSSIYVLVGVHGSSPGRAGEIEARGTGLAVRVGRRRGPTAARASPGPVGPFDGFDADATSPGRISVAIRNRAVLRKRRMLKVELSPKFRQTIGLIRGPDSPLIK